MTAAWTLRDMQPGDRAYVLSSCARGLTTALGERRHLSHAERAIVLWGSSEYARRVLRAADVRVVCAADDDDVILGWCAARDGVLWWIDTKASVRRAGVATALCADLGPQRYAWRPLDARVHVPAAWTYDPDVIARLRAREEGR